MIASQWFNLVIVAGGTDTAILHPAPDDAPCARHPPDPQLCAAPSAAAAAPCHDAGRAASDDTAGVLHNPPGTGDCAAAATDTGAAVDTGEGRRLLVTACSHGSSH